jgi:hypothetical protein
VATVRKRPPGKANLEELNFLRLDGDGWTAMLMHMDEDDSIPCPAFEESQCPV